MIPLIEDWLVLAWKILAFVLIISYLPGIIKAFKGGNGVFQTDEVSKMGIFFIFLYMISVEAERAHEWMIFPISLYVLLIFAILVMAKLETAIKYFIDFIKAWRNKE